MRGVAAEAGWSTGALNHYFADKEELLLLAFHEVAGRSSARLTAAGSLREARGGAAPARRRAPGRGARVVRAAGAGAHAARAGARAARRLSRLPGLHGRRAARGAGARRAGARPRPRLRGDRAGGVRRRDLGAGELRSARVRDPRASSRYSTSAWPRYVRGRDGRTASLPGRRPARARPARAAGRGALDPLRAARAGGRLHPHARRARGARDRARGRLRHGAGRGPRRRRRAAALHPPHRREPRLGARAGPRPRPTRSPAPGELHAEQQAADRRLAALGAERFEPGDRALTHCNTGALATGGIRHRRRRAAGGLGAGPAGLGLGGRDAPAAPGRAAHRLGARARRHPVLRGVGLERGRADGARAGGPRGGGRRPHRGQRRRGQQGRHLPAGRAGGAARRAVLRRGAGLDDRPAPPPNGGGDPDRGARPGRARRFDARRELRLRRDAGRAGHAPSSPRRACSSRPTRRSIARVAAR